MKKGILVIILLSIGYTSLFASDLQLFEAGKKAFSVGLYSIALENFTSFLEEKDGNDKEDDAIYLSGIASYYLKKYNKSLTYLKALEVDYSDSPYVDKSYYWIGLNYYNLNSYSEAILWFDMDVKVGSKYVDISNLYSALSYIKIDKTNKAKESLLKVINNPDAKDKYVEESLYRLATVYLEEENASRAVNYLNKIIFNYSESKYYIDSLALLAESYFLLKEWANAKRTYLLLNENSSIYKESSYKRLSSICYNLGELEESREYLIKYVDEVGEESDVLIMLADLSIRLNDSEKAVEIFNKLKNKELPNEVVDENNYKLGTIHFKNKNYKTAYDNFIKVDTRESLYFSSLSGIYLEKDIMPSVIKLNDNYLNDKYTMDINNRYINYLEKSNKNDELETLLKHVVKKYPNNISYTLTYGEFLLEQRRFEESLKYLSKGYKEDSEYYSNISYKIGWIYYNKGEYARAIGFFNSLKDGDADYLKALYSKSIAYFQVGKLKQGKEGFLKLLESESKYKAEVSFYLGLIEKENHEFRKAITYFNTSKNKKSLYIDSLDSMAWSYYHLQEYKDALDIYKEVAKKSDKSIYVFNAANCYFYLEEYSEALKLYKDVVLKDEKLKSSAYYKVIEILFYLESDDEGFRYVKNYYRDFPSSNKPFEVIFNIGDNKLYNGDVNGALKVYQSILDIFTSGLNRDKAHYRQGEAYILNENYSKATQIYLSSIINNDSYSQSSIKELVSLLSKVSDPGLTAKVINNIESEITDKSLVLPIYIYEIRESIFRQDSIDRIDELISVSRKRSEIDTLLYLKALHYYSINDFIKSNEMLTTLLSSPILEDETRIEALLLDGSILEKNEKKLEAIDLYLKLYLNFPKKRDRASFALYKAIMITVDIKDRELFDKIYNIIQKEYEDTIWGKRGLDVKY